MMELNPETPKKNKNRKIRLETAHRLYRGFMERVVEANRNPEFAYFIVEVALFGSYLREEQKVGDIDLAIETVPKGTDALQRARERLTKTTPAPKGLLGVFVALTEVRRFLQQRSAWFHVDYTTALIQSGEIPGKIVYEIPNRTKLMAAIAARKSVRELHRIVSMRDGTHSGEGLE